MTIFIHNEPYYIHYFTKEKSTQAKSEWERQILIELTLMLKA